jgi:hypothetical protein
VIGCDADMRRALLDHLQQRLQHANNSPVGPVLALIEAAGAVEVTE